MSTISETLGANQRREFSVQADFLRVLTGSSLKLTFYRNSVAVQESSGVGAGYSIRLDEMFDRFDVTDLSGASNAVALLLGHGVKIDINSVTGSVDAGLTSPVRASMSNTQKTVTNASGQLVAANASRKFLLIQNNDSAGNVYVNLGGVAATTANGVKLPPGGSLVLDVVTPTGAVYAIGDIASNANVVVVEG